MRAIKHFTRLFTKKSASAVILGIVLAASLLLSLFFGSTGIDMKSVFADGVNGAHGRIFYYVRLPRTLAAFLSGVALSASGVIIQTVLNNPLAGPNIIGVNSGAGFAVLLTACVWPNMAGFTPAVAFVGALGASLFIFALSARAGAGKLTLILAGVAVNYILTSGMDALKTMFDDSAVGNAVLLTGGFSAVSITDVYNAMWYIFPALAAVVIGSGALNVLSLGDETAQTLGMNTRAVRVGFLVVAAVLSGAAVSIAGLLGFVGLVSPHVARKLVGSDNKRVVPCAMCIGGVFVPACDLLGRVVFAPYELRAGVVLSIVGGSFFLWLTVNSKRRRGL